MNFPGLFYSSPASPSPFSAPSSPVSGSITTGSLSGLGSGNSAKPSGSTSWSAGSVGMNIGPPNFTPFPI